MRLIILLLCCLALSTTSVFTLDLHGVEKFSFAYKLSSMLEKTSLSKVIGFALEAKNQTYALPETGDIAFQCGLILSELLNKMPSLPDDDTIPSMLTDMLNQGFESNADVMKILKDALDQDYDSMMRDKVVANINKLEGKKNGIVCPDVRTKNKNLIDYYKAIQGLQRESGGDSTLQGTITSIYRIYRQLPDLVSLRAKVCDDEGIFDFARETFFRNFHGFMNKLQDETVKDILKRTELEEYTEKFKDLLGDTLNQEGKDALTQLYTGVSVLRTRLEFTMAVFLRPHPYMVNLGEIVPAMYGREARQLWTTVDAQLYPGNSSKNPMPRPGPAVDENGTPLVIKKIRDANNDIKNCRLFVSSIPSIIQNKEEKSETVSRFCRENGQLQHRINLYVIEVALAAQRLHKKGLPIAAASVGRAALLPNTLYPDNSVNPKTLYPDLSKKNDLLPAVEKLEPNVFPEVKKRVKNLIDIMYGGPICQ